MTGPDYDHFCTVVHARSGLVLGPDKTYLVQSRLEPIARELGHADVRAFLAALRAAPESLVRRCVDAMATHESLFFRDVTPFEQLTSVVLPQIVANRPREAPIRIWCAACSSGQEPYSLAILAHELSPLLGGRRVEIVASDMSDAVLAKARAGLYSDFETRRGLTPERRARWFQVREGGAYEVSPELKSRITFRRHNLLDGAAGLGVFDVVFCRNVLIYFDRERKGRVLDQIAAVMAPDGALFLGSAETVIGLSNAFDLVPGTRGVYRPKGQLRAALAG